MRSERKAARRSEETLGLGGQGRLPNGSEEIDLQLDGRERLAFLQGSGVGVAHRRISDVAEYTAVQCPHRVVVALIGLHLEDRMTRFDGLQQEANQSADRRRR